VNDKLHIRTAQISDAEELLAIYKPYIENTAITFEYDVPTVEEFANRIKTTLKKYPYIVAELNGKIVGYARMPEFSKAEKLMIGQLKQVFISALIITETELAENSTKSSKKFSQNRV
jgi:hypothetical protein